MREVITAALFGSGSGVLDAFITAWRVPNMFRRFLGEGALATSLQTAMTEADAEGEDGGGRWLFRDTLRLVSWILLALCLVVMGLVAVLPDEIGGFAWLGTDPDAVRILTVQLTPYVVLVCLAALVSGALQVRGRYGAPAVAPAVMNVAWIAALGVIAWKFGGIGERDAGSTRGQGRAAHDGALARLGRAGGRSPAAPGPVAPRCAAPA